MFWNFSAKKNHRIEKKGCVNKLSLPVLQQLKDGLCLQKMFNQTLCKVRQHRFELICWKFTIVPLVNYTFLAEKQKNRKKGLCEETFSAGVATIKGWSVFTKND